MIGEQLVIGGRFRVERRLGQGGMAVVYLAHDDELERPVAVKVLERPDGDGDLRLRFVREARLAARLTHPNVVAVYDAGEHDGHPYIVMEYVEGETLGELVAREGRLPPDEVVRLGREACAGLQHAHDAGLVHRDVKPQNLLVRAGDGVLKVSDFGIARSVDATRLTMTGSILGTAGYLAPEQAAGGEAGPAADIYGLGAVLYEALTGRPPVEVRSLAELAAAQARPPTPVRELAPDVPPALEDAVLRALARRPEDRPASAAELARALDGAEPDASTVRLPAPTRRLRRPQRRVSGRLIAAAIALAAVAATAIALGTAGRAGDPAPVEPVPQHADPQQQARALSEWLRRNAAG